MTRRQQAIAKFRAASRNVSLSTTIGLWVCTVSTIGLLVASWCVPPLGAIDPSALKGGSLIFAFAALWELREAIREGLGFKLTHGETVIEVKDQNGTQDNEIKTDGDGEYRD